MVFNIQFYLAVKAKLTIQKTNCKGGLFMAEKENQQDLLKNATEYIYEKYPKVKDKMDNNDILLTNVEDIFYQMAMFVQDPDRYSFNLSSLYKYLTNDDLINAIQVIVTFFQKDTLLIEDKNSIFVQNKDFQDEKMYNHTKFAAFLTEHGLKYSAPKVFTYWSRGKIPKGDIMINGTPYWTESTVKVYLRQELQREEEKKKKKTK